MSIKDLKENCKDLSNIVPEAYYDLISRMIPGFIFTLFIYAAYPVKFELKWGYTVSAFLILSYVTGLVLNGISGRLLEWFVFSYTWDVLEGHIYNEEEKKQLAEAFVIDVGLINDKESKSLLNYFWRYFKKHIIMLVKLFYKKSKCIILTDKQKKIILEDMRYSCDDKSVIIKMLAEQGVFRSLLIAFPAGYIIGYPYIQNILKHILGKMPSVIGSFGENHMLYVNIGIIVVIEFILLLSFMDRINRLAVRLFRTWIKTNKKKKPIQMFGKHR
jgi:hypothetical protein